MTAPISGLNGRVGVRDKDILPALQIEIAETKVRVSRHMQRSPELHGYP